MGGNEAQPRLSATVHWSTHMPQHAALLDCRGEIAGRLHHLATFDSPSRILVIDNGIGVREG